MIMLPETSLVILILSFVVQVAAKEVFAFSPNCDIHIRPPQPTPSKSSAIPIAATNSWLYPSSTEINFWYEKEKLKCPEHIKTFENNVSYKNHAPFYMQASSIPATGQDKCRGKATLYDLTGILVVPFGPYQSCPTYAKCWFGLLTCGTYKQDNLLQQTKSTILAEMREISAIPQVMKVVPNEINKDFSIQSLNIHIRLVGNEIIVPEQRYYTIDTTTIMKKDSKSKQQLHVSHEDVLIMQYTTTIPGGVIAATTSSTAGSSKSSSSFPYHLEIRLMEFYPAILYVWPTITSSYSPTTDTTTNSSIDKNNKKKDSSPSLSTTKTSFLDQYQLHSLGNIYLGFNEHRCKAWTKCTLSPTCCGCEAVSMIGSSGKPIPVEVKDGSSVCKASETVQYTLPLCGINNLPKPTIPSAVSTKSPLASKKVSNKAPASSNPAPLVAAAAVVEENPHGRWIYSANTALPKGHYCHLEDSYSLYHMHMINDTLDGDDSHGRSTGYTKGSHLHVQHSLQQAMATSSTGSLDRNSSTNSDNSDSDNKEKIVTANITTKQHYYHRSLSSSDSSTNIDTNNNQNNLHHHLHHATSTSSSSSLSSSSSPSGSWTMASGNPCIHNLPFHSNSSTPADAGSSPASSSSSSNNVQQEEELSTSHWFYAPYTCRYHFYTRHELHSCLAALDIGHIHVQGDTISRDFFHLLTKYLGTPQAKLMEMKKLGQELVANKKHFHSTKYNNSSSSSHHHSSSHQHNKPTAATKHHPVLLTEGFGWDYNPHLMKLLEERPLPNVLVTNFGFAHRLQHPIAFYSLSKQSEYSYWIERETRQQNGSSEFLPRPQKMIYQNAKDNHGRRSSAASNSYNQLIRQVDQILRELYMTKTMGYLELDEFQLTQGRLETSYHPQSDGWHFTGTARQMEVIIFFNKLCNEWYYSSSSNQQRQ